MATFPLLPFIVMGASILVAAVATASARGRSKHGGRNVKSNQKASKLGEVEMHLQYALERASEAEAHAAGAGNGDRNTRLAQAEQAQYQATAARQAADRASAAAYGGTNGESAYAAKARAAAERAQAAADRAKYNASLAQG